MSVANYVASHSALLKEVYNMHGPRSRPWRFLALLQVLLLVGILVLPGLASAASDSISDAQSITVLKTYNIVRGDNTGNLNLDKPITRAEMIAIMVRSLGAEAESQYLNGLGAFQDAKGHWAEGYIAYAAAKNLVKGDGNGHVRPNDFISYGEALTLLLRVIQKEPTTGDWPVNVLITASDLKLVPTGITMANVNDQAIRGQIFASLGRAISTIALDSGKTVLQTYVATTPPTLKLDQTDFSTKDTTAKLSGLVKDASSVTVNGQPVGLTGNLFATTVSLSMGENKFTVVATDLAGNKAWTAVTITRIPPIATLDITGPAKVRPNGAASYTITAKNSNGQVTSLDGVTAKVTGNIGNFNLGTGTFTAGATPGKGQIVLTAGTLTKAIDVEVMGQDSAAARLSIRTINNGTAVSYTRPMTVQVEVQDVNGTFLNTDYGRPVTLSASGVAGLRVSPAVAYTDAGVAQFTVTATDMGTASLQAASTNLVGGYYTAQFGSNLRVKLSANPATVALTGVSTNVRITGTLVDENNSIVANRTGSDIYVQLSSTGTDGVLINSYVRIANGYSSSSQTSSDAVFLTGAQPGTATITGAVSQGQSLTVDSTNINLTVPTIGAGSHWDIAALNPYTPGVQSQLAVRLADASNATIPGAFALQLQVTTSNGDPENVQITVGNTAISPVIPAGTNASTIPVVRTTAGSVPFKISYPYAGQVYLTVVTANGTNSAYDQTGTQGVGVTAGGIPNKTFTLNFANTPTSVKLTADSELGNGLVAAATRPNGRAVTLHAFLTDSSGRWVPGSTGNITLSRRTNMSGTYGTNVPSTVTLPAIDGKADFTVYPTGNATEDTYYVTASLSGSPTSADVVIQVQNTVPSTPAVIAARGINNGVPGTVNFINPTDTGLELELTQDTTQHYVAVKVYTEYGTLLYTSPAIDVTQVAPRITVPKSAIPNGVSRLQVAYRNGYGDSARSMSTGNITNSVVATNFTISYAKYQRSTKTLTIAGSGFGGSTDVINPSLITIRDMGTGQSVTLSGAQLLTNVYSQMTFNLTGMTNLATFEDLTQFNGSDVVMTTSAGWYVRANGEQSAALTAGSPVGPFATISSVVYDRANSRLLLNGSGFSTVNVNTANLKLDNGSTHYQLTGYGSGRLNDSQWYISLPSAVVTALNNDATYNLQFADGWAYDNSWLMPTVPDKTLNAQVTITSVTYNSSTKVLTLNGLGLTGNVNVGNLQLADLNLPGNPITVVGSYDAVNSTDSKIIITGVDPATFPGFQANHAIYLVSDPAWLQITINGVQRDAAAIPARTLRVSWQ